MKKRTPIIAAAAGSAVYVTFAFISSDFDVSNWTEFKRLMCATIFWAAAFVSSGLSESLK